MISSTDTLWIWTRSGPPPTLSSMIAPRQAVSLTNAKEREVKGKGSKVPAKRLLEEAEDNEDLTGVPEVQMGGDVPPIAVVPRWRRCYADGSLWHIDDPPAG